MTNRRGWRRAGRQQLAVGLLVLACGAPAALAQVQFVEQQATRFPQPALTEYTNQCAIVDLDKDGDLDILFANGGGFSSAGPPQQARLYLNSGAGVFTDVSVASGLPLLNARDVQPADVDGDGDLDLLFVQDFAKPSLLYLNNGSGVFAAAPAGNFPSKNLGAPHACFFDMDNDGDLDVAIANGGASRFGTGPTQLFENKSESGGAGVFVDVTATNLPNSPVSQPMEAIAADVDGDLDLDLLIGSRGGVSKLFVNNGAGVFAFKAVPAGGNDYSMDFGDIDGDGDLDVLGINNKPGTAAESMWVNDGLGTFTDVTATALPGTNNPAVDDNDSKFFDPDYDGDLDFVIASLGSTERYYQNNGSGVFTIVAGKITMVADSSLDIEMGDLDNDGDLDFVTAQGESGSFINRIYMNTLGPSDTRAPVVHAIEQVADTGDAGGPYVVRAEVRDDMTADQGAFFQSVAVAYSVNGGATQQVAMEWVGHNMYRGEIPGQACGSNVLYQVEVKDRAGNAASSAVREFDVLAYADCDASGGLSIDDFICFQTFFALGDPYADCDGSGGLSIDDFICFQTFFAIGC